MINYATLPQAHAKKEEIEESDQEIQSEVIIEEEINSDVIEPRKTHAKKEKEHDANEEAKNVRNREISQA